MMFVDRKSVENQSNPTKIDFLRALGGFLEGAGSLLGRLEANLRAKKAPSWILEASWEGLGGLLGRLEIKLRAKMGVQK